MELILIVTGMDDRIEMQLVDLGDRADVAGHRRRNLSGPGALQSIQVRRLEAFAPVTDEHLVAGPDRALVHPKRADLAHVGINVDLEYVADEMIGRFRRQLHVLRRFTAALQKHRGVGLQWARHQSREDIQQLIYARTGLRRNEAHRDQMSAAQRPLKGIMQLLGADLLTLLQVDLHQLFVELHHLVDDLRVRGVDVGEVRRVAVRGEEAIRDRCRAGSGQIQRQTLIAEGLADLVHQRLEIDVVRINAIHDDHATELLLCCETHDASRDEFDTGLRIDNDGRSLDGRQHAHRATDEVGIAGRVEHIHENAVVFEVTDGGFQGMLELFFGCCVIRNGIAAIHAPGRSDRPRPGEQGFQ